MSSASRIIIEIEMSSTKSAVTRRIWLSGQVWCERVAKISYLSLHSNRLAQNYGDLTAKEGVFKNWVKVLPMRGEEMHTHVRKFLYDRRS